MVRTSVPSPCKGPFIKSQENPILHITSWGPGLAPYLLYNTMSGFQIFCAGTRMNSAPS